MSNPFVSFATRNSYISCGITCGVCLKFRKKLFLTDFVKDLGFPGNTLVGNCFLRILGSGGKAKKSTGIIGSVLEEFSCRKKSADTSAAKDAGKSGRDPLP